MKIKGLEELREHVPDLHSPAGSAWIAILGIGMFSLMIYSYTMVNRNLPIWGPDGQIIFTALGFWLLRNFFAKKEQYRERHGELAYRNALVRLVLPGLALIFASIAYTGFIPGPRIPLDWWHAIRPYVGWYFTLVGAVLWLRAVITFGLDNLAMLYVYFPEKGRQVDTSIYDILRHPVYAGALRLCLGLACLNGNIFAVIFGFLVFPFGLFAWVRLVEERDLIERFGEGYIDYRKSTPAFWPQLKNLGNFWKYIISG